MKRFHALDILRGFMMTYIIILHALIQRVFVSDPSAFPTTIAKLPLALVLVISPLIIISLWGSVFSFMTGIASAYQLGSLSREYPQDSSRQNRFLTKRLATSIMIYIIYLLNNLLFSTRSIEHGFSTQSLLTGSLENLSVKAPTFFTLTATSTLETIAITGIIVSLVVRAALKKHANNPYQIIKKLSTISLIILAISAFLRQYIGDPMPVQEYLLSKNQYVLYFFFMRLYSARFALLPVLGFGFMGASLGLLLSQKVSFKEFAKYAFSHAALLFGIFGLYLLNGFKIIDHFAEEQTPIPLQFMNLGLQICTIAVLAWLFDYASPKKREKRLKRVKFLERFNNSSLSIFVLEPFIASALYLGYHSVFGDFSENFIVVISFMINLGAIWYVILRFWQKVNYKGSCEWIVKNGKQWIANWSLWNKLISDSQEKQRNLFYLTKRNTQKPISITTPLYEINGYNQH